MVKSYKPGARARRLILAELRRREDEGADSPTLRELGEVTGRSHTSARRHVDVLVDAGLVERRGRGRVQKIALTPAGRIATD